MSVLSDLEQGGEAILEQMELPDAVCNHLMYMGFVPDARVRMIRRAPAGDPTVYAVDGIEVALRHETAKHIRVHAVSSIFELHPGVAAKFDSNSQPELLPIQKQAVGAK